MNIDASKMPELLEALKEYNIRRDRQTREDHGNEIADELSQAIQHPCCFEGRIPTLEHGIYRSSTPMLTARFEYAGSWVNAYLGQTFLGIPEMEQVWENAEIIKKIQDRQIYWDKSAPSLVPWERLSLFGLEYKQSEEIYLLWDCDDSIEPCVYSYAGNYEERFPNLADFILYCSRGG